ncbi:MAG: ketoacyl-ACP synthase III [Acetilactobacillus jinshanensis]
MNRFSILATARAVPKKVVTNDDLSKIMKTSDAWISRRTGIHERRVATTETTTSLSADVARQLLKKSGVKADDLDYVIVATMSSDYMMPSTAAAVQGIIGAKHAAAFDISAACSGFAYGIKILDALLAQKPNAKGILIGGETMTKYINWADRSTAVLFGDGAGGILAANSGSGRIITTDLATYGDLGSKLTAGHFGYQDPQYHQTDKEDRFCHQDGRAIYGFAIRKVPKSIRQALKQANLSPGQIKYFVLHQANARIVKSVSRHLHVPFAKFPISINRYGNTVAASEPMLLSRLVDSGKIKHGDIIDLTGFGGGLTVGTVILKF